MWDAVQPFLLHAEYFGKIISQIGLSFANGDVVTAMNLFSKHRHNSDRALQWLLDNPANDEEVIELCIDYLQTSIMLSTYLNDNTKLRDWGEEALKATPDPDDRFKRLGLFAVANANFAEARYKEAEKLGLQALTYCEIHQDQVNAATALDFLGRVQHASGENASAKEYYRRSLDILKAITPHPLDMFARVQNNLAAVCFAEGQYDEAESLQLKSRELFESLGLSTHPDVAASLHNLAGIQARVGRLADAKRLYGEAISMLEKTLPADHPDIAETLVQLADVCVRSGDYGSAEAHFARSREILNHTSLDDHPRMADTFSTLAGLYLVKGAYSDAEECYTRAIHIFKARMSGDSAKIADCLGNLALVYKRQGRDSEAARTCLEALTISEKTLPSDHLQIATFANNLAGIYGDQGRYQEAEELFFRALHIRSKKLPNPHLEIAVTLNDVGMLLLRQGRHSMAERHLMTGLNMREDLLSQNHPDIATSLCNLSLLYLAQQRYREAEMFLRRAVSIYETSIAAESPEFATILHNLAIAYIVQGNVDDAIPNLTRALSIRLKILPPKHQHVFDTLKALRDVYEDQDGIGKAEEMYVSALLERVDIEPAICSDVMSCVNDCLWRLMQYGHFWPVKTLYRSCLEIAQVHLPANHAEMITARTRLAQAYEMQQNYDGAESYYQQLVAISKAATPRDDHLIVGMLGGLGYFYEKRGRTEDAKQLYHEMLGICERVLPGKHPDAQWVRERLHKMHVAVQRKKRSGQGT